MKTSIKITSDLPGFQNMVGLESLPGFINPAGFVLAFCLVCCAACDSDKIYQEEQYKNMVYLLSGSENIYTEAYTLNETESVRYFSVVCGGSNTNEKEIVVTIEPDLASFDRYNMMNFDHENLYAKLLPANRYEVGTYTVTIPAHPVDQYVKVPVKVRPLGLSPDTVYFIPLAIKSVSKYEVNDDKYNLLYRVTIENDYARQKVVTYYTKKGTVINQSNSSATVLTGNKIVHPMTGSKVRMFVGNYTQGSASTVDDITMYAIVVEVKEDNTLDITPYGTIEVEMLNAEGYNRYYPEVTQGTKVQRIFYLHYRYRILNANGMPGDWMEMKESLTRVEED